MIEWLLDSQHSNQDNLGVNRNDNSLSGKLIDWINFLERVDKNKVDSQPRTEEREFQRARGSHSLEMLNLGM